MKVGTGYGVNTGVGAGTGSAVLVVGAGVTGDTVMGAGLALGSDGAQPHAATNDGATGHNSASIKPWSPSR